MKVPRFFNRARESAARAVTSIVQIAALKIHVAQANLWRDHYNPLRGLTMRRVVQLLEEGERGAYAELQWTYRFIEKRDAVLRGGKRSLVSAVSSMDWEIRTVAEEKLPAGVTKAMAEAQQKTLRSAYDRIENMREAIEHLCLAEFRGYAHLEKRAAAGGPNDGAVVRLEPIEQWFLCRDGVLGDWKYNARSTFGVVKGEDVPPELVIVREVEDPIDEIALIAFVRKNLSQKDWDGYVESYGIPSVFAVMPQQVPQGQEDKYLEIAEKVIGNARGALPAGSDIKTVDNGARGVNPFRDHLRYQDEQITLAITSGLLTMLAESGSGTLAGGAHSETFDRIAAGLAGRISETFQAQFDKDILAASHPNEPVLAYFAIAAEEETDTGAFIDGVQKLSLAGYHVSAEQIAEKSGYEVEVKGPGADPTEQRPTQSDAAPRTPKLPNRAVDRMAAELGVASGWVQPIEDLLTEMEARAAGASEEDFARWLEEAQARLPELLSDMDAEALAAVFEATMGTAVTEGVRAALRKGSGRP